MSIYAGSDNCFIAVLLNCFNFSSDLFRYVTIKQFINLTIAIFLHLTAKAAPPALFSYHPPMRKNLSIPLFCLLLAACGGGSAEVACDNTYTDAFVGTCLPDGWHSVDRSELDNRGVPAEVTTAFQSDAPYSGQFGTITVTREVLPQDLTSEKYSDASVLSVQTLPGYEEVDRRNLTIDGASVTLHIFTAQPRDDQPESRFYQVSAVSPDHVGYTFTGATPVSVPDELETQVLAILRNVTLVQPEEAVDDEEAAE